MDDKRWHRGIRRRGQRRIHVTDEVEREDRRKMYVGSRSNVEPALCGQMLPIMATEVVRVYVASQVTCRVCQERMEPLDG